MVPRHPIQWRVRTHEQRRQHEQSHQRRRRHPNESGQLKTNLTSLSLSEQCNEFIQHMDMLGFELPFHVRGQETPEQTDYYRETDETGGSGKKSTTKDEEKGQHSEPELPNWVIVEHLREEFEQRIREEGGTPEVVRLSEMLQDLLNRDRVFRGEEALEGLRFNLAPGETWQFEDVEDDTWAQFDRMMGLPGLFARDLWDYRRRVIRWLADPLAPGDQPIVQVGATLRLSRKIRNWANERGENVDEVLRPLVEWVQEQIEKRRQGKNPRLAYTDAPFRSSCGRSDERSWKLHDWHKEIPESPDDDLRTERRNTGEQILYHHFFDVYVYVGVGKKWDVRVHWDESNPVIQQIENIRIYKEKFDMIKEVIGNMRLNKKKVDVRAIATMVNELGWRAGRGGDEVRRREPNNDQAVKQAKALLDLYVRYNSIWECYSLLPQIVHKACLMQRKYLQTGDTNSLIALTKADLIRAIGYTPSADKKTDSAKGKDDLIKQEVGRRLERYMERVLIRFQSGRGGKEIPMKKLLAEPSRIRDARGDRVTIERIRNLIRRLIDEEDEQNPLSDRALAEMVEAKFQIRVDRRTVTNHRKALGIPCSRARRANFLER